MFDIYISLRFLFIPNVTDILHLTANLDMF